MKAMISQPMKDKSPEEIAITKQKATDYLSDLGYEVIDTYFNSEFINIKEGTNIPLFYLSKSLEKMSECDAVLFCNDWCNYRGCLIEYQAANKYGLIIMSHDFNIE